MSNRYSFAYEDNFSLFTGEGFFENRRYRCILTDNKTDDTYKSDWHKTRAEAKADVLDQAGSASD